MSDTPDYRTQPSATLEGSRRAVGAWEHFHMQLARDEVEEAYALAPLDSVDLDPLARDDLLATQIEEADLLGFWLAWHRAGGFANLERAGWNRATIFRRIRRFRTAFGTHPDDYDPGWIHLDLHTVWGARIRARLHATGDTPSRPESPSA